MATKATFLSVTEKDALLYRALGSKNAVHLPLFLPNWQVSGKGKGCFCLYQGDLSTPENERAVKWLVEEVFNDLELSIVVAGKQPSNSLEKLLHKQSNTCLVANPSETEMQDLIAKAHINIIPSYNATGIKLKLINALYNGRHCLVNPATISGSGLEEACNIAETATEFKEALNTLYSQPFADEEVQLRQQLLNSLFNNSKNAVDLISIVWGPANQS